jgi:hypothetical protein
MMRAFVFGLLVLVGCGDEPAPAATSAAPLPVAPVQPPPPSRPTRLERVDAYPRFSDGELVSCTDVTFVVERAEGISEERERELRDRSEQAQLPAEMLEHHRADQDCATVTRRAALATCSRNELYTDDDDHTRGRRVSSSTKNHYYSFDLVFEGDELMAACLSDGGSWDVVERNSAAALEAEGRHLARERERFEQRFGRRR